MSLLDMDTLTAAFKSHVDGSEKFTRRMAIALADMDGTTPRQLVLRCERLRLLNEGSWDWFAENGGITAEHIRETRDGHSNSAVQATPAVPSGEGTKLSPPASEKE